MLAEHELMHRWPPGTMLVLDLSALEEKEAGEVVSAFDTWLTETRVPVRARRAEPGEPVNVVVRSVDRPQGGARAVGRTELHWRGPWISRATVELAERDSRGRPVSRLARRTAVVHEVGHVLGLRHSRRMGSVMHPSPWTWGVDGTDRAALSLLYRTIPAGGERAAAATAPLP